MALSIKNAETEEAARELAAVAGESLTEAVGHAVRERLARLRRRQEADRDADAVEEICRRYRALPLLDDRSADEILGYDEDGLP